MIVLSLTELLRCIKSGVDRRGFCFCFSSFSCIQLWIAFTYGSWITEAESRSAVLLLFKFSNICALGPKPISPVGEAGWTLSAAETKMGSNFNEMSSKILLIFVLCESHKVMCSRGWKGNRDSSKSGRIIFFSLQFPFHILSGVVHEGAGGRYAIPSLRSTELYSKSFSLTVSA